MHVPSGVSPLSPTLTDSLATLYGAHPPSLSIPPPKDPMKMKNLCLQLIEMQKIPTKSTIFSIQVKNQRQEIILKMRVIIRNQKL
jgi:hypothetical protein